MDIERWKSQMRKGAAELAVLNVLSKGESYGLEILEVLSGYDHLQISEGSIYPLLNRLQKSHRIGSEWRMLDDAIHPRKYYFLTELGTGYLSRMNHEWIQFANAMAALIADEKGDAP